MVSILDSSALTKRRFWYVFKKMVFAQTTAVCYKGVDPFYYRHSITYFGTRSLPLFGNCLNVLRVSISLPSVDKLFHSRKVEGKKELEYRVVLECIVCRSLELRKLYVVVLPTFWGTRADRHVGVKLCFILKMRPSLWSLRRFWGNDVMTTSLVSFYLLIQQVQVYQAGSASDYSESFMLYFFYFLFFVLSRIVPDDVCVF